jgi:hypothetical protein
MDFSSIWFIDAMLYYFCGSLILLLGGDPIHFFICGIYIVVGSILLVLALREEEEDG